MDFYLPSDIYKLEKQLTQSKYTQDELISMASNSVANFIFSNFADKKHVLIFCGKGSNAADGFVLANILSNNYKVTIVKVFSADELSSTASIALRELNPNVNLSDLNQDLDDDYDLLVDAILGIGARAGLAPNIDNGITIINNLKLPTIAIDIPSGINASTGHSLGNFVRANFTITFFAPKVGLVLADGRDASGKIIVSDLIDSLSMPPALISYEYKNIAKNLPTRNQNSHKGNYPSVLIVAGGDGYLGALLLCIRTVIKMGAGLVYVVTEDSNIKSTLELYPTIIITSFANKHLVDSYIDKSTVCLLGPGISNELWAKAILSNVIEKQKRAVIDAGCIRMLGCEANLNNLILTPHPGEAAALLDSTSNSIQQDRLGSITKIVNNYNSVCILKGSGSIIHSPNNEVPILCDYGNPGLATAGMGDVLAAMVAVMLGYFTNELDAASIATYMHSYAADIIAKDEGCIGIEATDLIDKVHQLINKKDLI